MLSCEKQSNTIILMTHFGLWDLFTERVLKAKIIIGTDQFAGVNRTVDWVALFYAVEIETPEYDTTAECARWRSDPDRHCTIGFSRLESFEYWTDTRHPEQWIMLELRLFEIVGISDSRLISYFSPKTVKLPKINRNFEFITKLRKTSLPCQFYC